MRPYPGADTNQSVSVTGAEAGQSGRILGFRTADTPQLASARFGD